MPKTLLALTSLLPFLWFICFWKKKKKELQHIVVFNIYKGRFLLFLEKKKKMLGTGELLSCPLACDQIHDFYWLPVEESRWAGL